MKILHVIGGVAWRYGGTTSTVLSLCEALARKPGVQVEIATTDADGPDGRITRQTVPETSFPVHLFRRDYSESWKFSLGLFQWLRHHAGDYELIHIHAVWSFATTAACWGAQRHRVPYVILPQGMLSPYSWNRSPRMKQLYWKMLERRNLSRASRLIVTSTGERDEVARLGLPTGVDHIPLGLANDAWEAPTRPHLLKELCQGRNDGRPTVLYLSRLHPKKGLAEFLVPAFKALGGDAFLAIAGGPDSYAPEYAEHARNEVTRLGLADRVAFLGPINQADRWALYDGADVFALPSQNENFGLVVTEAMARGCPVVVSSEAYSSEHVAAADAGKVVPLRVPELTAALRSMLADPAGRAAMGRRGREYARRHLGWDTIADSVLEMYSRCLLQPCVR
jgi:glycosyltransferase involved in cell wall biosynthesis